MRNISASLAQRIKNKSPLAIGKQPIQTVNAKHDGLLIALHRMEELFGGVLGNNRELPKHLQTMLEAILRPINIATS